MERAEAVSTIKDEVATGANVTLKVAKPVAEAVKPFVLRSLGEKYRNVRQKFASIKKR